MPIRHAVSFAELIELYGGSREVRLDRRAVRLETAGGLASILLGCVARV